jgi:hypothetical protein
LLSSFGDDLNGATHRRWRNALVMMDVRADQNTPLYLLKSTGQGKSVTALKIFTATRGCCRIETPDIRLVFAPTQKIFEIA